MSRPAPANIDLGRAAAIALFGAVLLAGCASTSDRVGSVTGGECRLVHAPDTAVAGRTDYDQRWINTTTEALVTGCGQPRPQARPPEWDAKPAAKKAARKPVAKRSRLRELLSKKKSTEPGA